MTLAVDNAAPSTLADVIGQVVEAFQEMGNATPILVGKGYLERGQGSAPRVVFVPEQGGKMGPASELGRAASIGHGCDVYVLAEHSGEDLQRFRAAYLLADLVIDCIATAAPGRIEWSAYTDSSPNDIDAEIKFSFTYRRDVPHNVTRWSLPAATADSSAKQPGVPPGQPGTVDSVSVTTIPEEP